MKIDIKIKKISNGFVVHDGEKEFYRETLDELFRLLTSDKIREAQKAFAEYNLEGQSFYLNLETNILDY